jgi:hypothetical protein
MSVKKLYLSVFLILAASPAFADRPVVVELYTAQGCPSCPAADEFLRELSNDKTLLPFSLHVNYWDKLGWKDPYATESNTSRQRSYMQVNRQRNVYTPQMVIDGHYSAVGSDREAVNAAIRNAQNEKYEVPITVNGDEFSIKVSIGKRPDSTLATPSGGILWAFHYIPASNTPVDAGGNSGKTMISTNTVVAIERVGFWHNSADNYQIPHSKMYTEDMALILQSSPHHKILGVATYHRPKQ